MGDGFVDLHCHLIHGVDDGAKSLDDSLLMARALVALGFSDVAPSPHARREYASLDGAFCASQREALQQALHAAKVPLTLHPNAENFFFEEGFVENVHTDKGRRLGAGKVVLVEAPYTSPMPRLTDILFRLKLKGVTCLIAHPERCLEFERPGRAQEAVSAGALLQLDVGALTGRYGPTAKKLGREFLDNGLYAVGATDLHSPVGAEEWIGKAFKELRSRAGEQGFVQLMKTNPGKLLRGVELDG